MKKINLGAEALAILALVLGFGEPAVTGASEPSESHPVADALVVGDVVVDDEPDVDDGNTGGSAMVGCIAVDDSDSNRVGNPDDPPADPGPVLIRVEATKYIVSHLGTEGRQADRIGIVVFGGSGPDDLVEIPLIAIDGPEVREWLGEALDAAIYSKRWTNWPRAISRCLGMLDRAGFGRAPSQSPPSFSPFIVFTSDGRPEDESPGASTGEQLQELRESLLPDLASRGIPVFSIGYGGAGDPTSSEAGLMRGLADATGGSFLAARSPGDLLPLADSIVASIRGGQFEAGEAVSVSQGTAVPITVPADTERLFIGARRSNADMVVDLVAADGLEVNPTDEGVERSESVTFVTWTIIKPDAGTWQVKAFGDGIIAVDTTIVGSTPTPTPTPPSTPPTVDSTPTAEAGRAAGTSPSDGGGGVVLDIPLIWLAAAAAVAAPLGLVAFVTTRLRPLRLPGWITIEKEETHE